MKRARHVRGWIQDKPFLLAALAIQAACICRWLEEFYKCLDGDAFQRDLPPMPKPGEWLTQYSRFKNFEGLVGIGQGTGSAVVGIFDSVREFYRLPVRKRLQLLKSHFEDSEWRKALKHSREKIVNARDELLKELEDDISGVLPTSRVRRRAMKLLGTAEYQFLFRVAVPCWLLFSEHPGRLLHQARSGTSAESVEAIANLVQVDFNVLADSRIQERLSLMRRRGHQFNLGDVGKSFAKLKCIPDGGSLKMLMSAFIWQMSRAMRHPLNVPEIRRLFNAVCRDYGGPLNDLTLPDQDAYYKAVKRHVRFWTHLLGPDKKRR